MNAEAANDWSALATTAMLGCERAPAVPALPEALAALGADNVPPEQRLLRHAALLSPWVRAGQVAPSLANPIAPCPEDHGRPAAHAGAVLGSDLDGLILEWCATAARFQRRVPEHLLPQFLDRLAKEKDRATASAMRAVLGERGAWLAAINPDWRLAQPAAITAPDAAWQAGTVAERIVLLRALREGDPAAAPRLIASTQEGDAPDDVAQFVAELAAGLTMADHDFLEGLLDARHKPVRGSAAALLARLTASGRGKRAAERLQARLKFTAGASGFLKKKKAVIEATLPDKEAAADAKALARDGIDTARKRGKLGPKAATLLQLAAAAPLAGLAAEWKANPGEILDAALDGEWAEALVIGWAQAAIAQREADWAAALLERFAGRAGGMVSELDTGDFGRLLRVLPPDKREAFVIEVIEERPRAVHDNWIHQLLDAMDHAWTADFSRRLLKVLRGNYLSESSWTLRAAVGRMAVRLAPETAAGLSDGWPVNAAQWNSGDQDMLARLESTLDLRRRYLQELAK